MELLPDPPPDNPKQAEIQGQILGQRQSIEDIVKKTTRIGLEPAQEQPILGLNSIIFKFGRSEEQSIPISQVNKAAKDIGIKTGRAPVRIEIGANVCVELPLHRDERRFVPIKPLLAEILRDINTTGQPTYLIGRDQYGAPFELDMKSAKHILVGGGTGGGKSVLLHSIIFGIIFRYSPALVRLALADHKRIEFSCYHGLPHLWQPIVTSEEGFLRMVENLDQELEKRKNILIENPAKSFPILLTIIDEFAGYDHKKLVRLIAQARALDMYFILAAQYPRGDVISTAIKTNLITSIAFKTKETAGSRLIIGTSDAVSLQGQGDCLVLTESGQFTRVQAGWVSSPKDRDPADISSLKSIVAQSRG